MCRTSVGNVLILLLLAGRSWALLKNTESKPLDDWSELQVSLNNPSGNGVFMQQISIAPTSDISFNIKDIPSGFSFIILQVHTYQYNVTLSYDKESLYKVTNRSTFGSNIGLFIQLNGNPIQQLYLKNDNVRVVEALVVAVAYSNEMPIPGGCNMEFETEVAPYEKLFMQDGMIIVHMQPAWVSAVEESLGLCEKSPVKHEMYQMYLPEQDYTPSTYFSAIRSMLTVNDIVQNGIQVPSSSITPMKYAFNSYTGVGSIYVAVATYKNRSVPYVPIFSYGCSPLVDPESCLVLIGTVSKLVCAASFFLGFFSVLFGYVSPRVDMALPVLFGGTVIAYTIVVATTDHDTQSHIGIAIAIGICVVLAWAAVDQFSITFTQLVHNLTLGLFIAGIAFCHVPVSYVMIQNDWIFWSLVVTVTFAVAMLASCLFRTRPTLTCSIFGSYMMILPLDYYFGSSLKYIIINMVRRVIIDEFRFAIIITPYQFKDVCLTIFWVFLTLYHLTNRFFPNALLTCLKRRPRKHTYSETTPLMM